MGDLFINVSAKLFCIARAAYGRCVSSIDLWQTGRGVYREASRVEGGKGKGGGGGPKCYLANIDLANTSP